ncbi:DUF4065 domain-containing protein [Niallia circulans]|uniref:Panacea domain-containing protein n=1 Tax=Niallia circulans TaxID=1397 RepID=UPI00397C1FC6
MTTQQTIQQVDVEDVASAFLSIESMTPKKLQKLCYYAYSWYLTLYRDRLFTERFEAWIHGPVAPKLYRKYKLYGRSEIPMSDSPINLDSDNPISEIITMVYNSYGHLDGDELEHLTHLEAPWLTARAGLTADEPSNNELEDYIIEDYYRNIYEQGQND